MHDKTALQMMQRCKSEIDHLNRRVAELRPYAEAYHTIARLAKQGDPEHHHAVLGHREDLSYTLSHEISALEHRMAEEDKRAKRANAEAAKTRGDPVSVSDPYASNGYAAPDDAGGDAPSDVS